MIKIYKLYDDICFGWWLFKTNYDFWLFYLNSSSYEYLKKRFWERFEINK